MIRLLAIGILLVGIFAFGVNSTNAASMDAVGGGGPRLCQKAQFNGRPEVTGNVSGVVQACPPIAVGQLTRVYAKLNSPIPGEVNLCNSQTRQCAASTAAKFEAGGDCLEFEISWAAEAPLPDLVQLWTTSGLLVPFASAPLDAAQPGNPMACH